MKKTVIIALVAIVGLCAFNTIKQKEYKLTQGQVNILFNAMQVSAKAIPVSKVISADDANTALQGLDSIARVLARQYQDTAR
jgi:hypothetical protein